MDLNKPKILEKVKEPGQHEFLYSLFENQNVLKLEERLADLYLGIPSLMYRPGRNEMVDSDKFIYQSQDLGRIYRLMLDNNPECVVAAVKVFFNELPKRPFEKFEVRQDISPDSLWRARQIVNLQSLLERLSQREKPFESGIENWAEEVKAQVGIVDFTLSQKISRDTKEALRRVKNIFGNEEAREKPPYFAQVEGLIYAIGENYRVQATYEVLGKALENEDWFEFASALTYLEKLECVDEVFIDYLRLNWSSLTGEAYKYLEYSPFPVGDVAMAYNQSDEERRKWLIQGAVSVFEKYVKNRLSFLRSSVYR